MTRINTTVRVWDTKRQDFLNLQATIDIDPAKIAYAIGAQAYKNKSKASKLAAGGVVLTIVSPNQEAKP